MTVKSPRPACKTLTIPSEYIRILETLAVQSKAAEAYIGKSIARAKAYNRFNLIPLVAILLF